MWFLILTLSVFPNVFLNTPIAGYVDFKVCAAESERITREIATMPIVVDGKETFDVPGKDFTMKCRWFEQDAFGEWKLTEQKDM